MAWALIRFRVAHRVYKMYALYIF
ncbi:protein of unknown function [Thauera humireducens]|nr:protein of unknown function [Thauera humireducens]